MTPEPPAPPLRVGVVGPLLGHHPGWVVSQGERLAGRLGDDGLTVRTASGRIGRVSRAMDTVRTMRSWTGDVDVVVAMVFSGPAFVMADLAGRSTRRLRVPLVLWLHGGNLPDFTRRHPRWVRSILARADAVVAPSPYLVGSIGPWCPVPVMIPNLLPEGLGELTSPLPPAFMPRGPRLLWMRTFHPLYRPDTAVDVLARLLREHPGTMMTMAGQDRGSLEATERLVRAEGLADHVRFAGFLDGPAKHRAFTEHDIFVNTTSVDNAPVSLIEAAAHGLPIVSTAVGGIPDLFPDGDAALLADDAAGLAAAVLRLLDEPGLGDAVKAAAYDRARACTWERVGPQWHRLLAEVTGAEACG